jgi:HEAT repeat protein
MDFRMFGAGAAVAAALLSGCGGISDCGEDGAKCAALLNANAEKCAEAFQLAQSESKRKHCENAIKVVAKAQAKDAVPALMKIVAAPDSAAPYDSHRIDAAKALADLGAKEAVDALLGAFDLGAGTSADPRDKNANRSNETIAEVLGQLGDAKACGKLEEAAKKSRHDYTVLKSVRSLGELDCKASVPALGDIALKHENKFMRKNAVVALGQIGDPAGVDALIQMMFVEYQGVSFYPEASFALFEVGPAAADALLELMALKNQAVNAYFEKSGGIKETAIKAKAGFVLGDLRDQRAVDPLLEAFKAAGKNNDPVLAIYAAAPLGALGDKRAVPVLLERAMTVDASQRDPIMRALVQLGDRAAVPQLLKAMSFEDFVARCMKETESSKEQCSSDDTKAALFGAQKAAADHASNLAGADHLDLYKKVVEGEKDKDIKAYFEARQKRVEAAAECKSDAACWTKKLTDADPLVREKAAWELSFLKDPSTNDALAKALGDKDNYARAAAIAAYWTYGKKSAVPAIEKQLADEAGSTQYIRVNQDLKRLLVALRRQP